MKIIKRTDTSSNIGHYSPMRSMLDDFFSSDSLLDEVFSRNFTSKNLFVDVWEENDSFIVKMAMPGVDKDSIEITTTADTVTIRGGSKKEDEKRENKKNYYFRSLESSYEQTFNLPTKVDSDRAVAAYSDGILTLTLPKSEEVKPKKITIK